MADRSKIVLNGTEYSLKDAAARGMISSSEASSTASSSHAIGDYFIYNGLLYQASVDIAVGDTITPGTNCNPMLVTNELMLAVNGKREIDITQYPLINCTISGTITAARSGTNYTSRQVTVEPAWKTIAVTASSSTSVLAVTFLKTAIPSNIANGTDVSSYLSTGETGRHVIDPSSTQVLSIPNDCAYIFISTKSSSVDVSPESVIAVSQLGSTVSFCQEVEEKRAADAALVNSLHSLVNYGYDTPFDGNTNSSTTWQIVVNRRGVRVTSNASLPEGTSVRVVLSLPTVVSYASNVPSIVKGTGLKLIDGHVYRIRSHYVSGTASATVYLRFINAVDGAFVTGVRYGVDALTGDTIATLTYDAATLTDGVHVALLAHRPQGGNDLVDYTVDVTLEDITFGAPESVQSNLAPIESAQASASYAAGALLMLNGQLYETTVAIASGETLEVGTNIRVTSVYEQLAAIRALLN